MPRALVGRLAGYPHLHPTTHFWTSCRLIGTVSKRAARVHYSEPPQLSCPSSVGRPRQWPLGTARWSPTKPCPDPTVRSPLKGICLVSAPPRWPVPSSTMSFCCTPVSHSAAHRWHHPSPVESSHAQVLKEPLREEHLTRLQAPCPIHWSAATKPLLSMSHPAGAVLTPSLGHGATLMHPLS
jgi:hypothetical protein